MKKLLLMLLCLFVVSVFATAAFASSDVGNIANNDSIQISENADEIIPVTKNVTLPDSTDDSSVIMESAANQTVQNTSDYNETVHVESDVNQTIQSTALPQNCANQSSPKLNITGPKINSSNLHIKGPKITGKGPIIALSQMDKDIYHFAKIFCEHPDWDLYDCIDYVRFHSNYHWHEISIIVAKAHNIALHKYKGKDIMVLGWDVTPESVEFRSKNFYGWK